jgi:hypothetical protein
VTKHARASLVSAWQCFAFAGIFASVFFSGMVLAQTAPAEQTFHVSRSDVEKALRKLQAYSGARLPTLDGFVDSDEQSLDSYQRGYYQYSIQISSENDTESRVRVSAKITAWHEDHDPSKSGYRVLSSNGRLESDLFERLGAALNAQPAGASGSLLPQPQSSSKPGSADSTAAQSAPMTARPATEGANPFTTPRSISPAVPSRAEAVSGNSPRDLMDRHVQQLTQEEQGLQEVLRNQAHPDNLAAVKTPRTPVLSRPLASASVLFLADAEDEFQVLGIQGDWVHVQISGLSRGWIRASQLDLPGTVPNATPNQALRSESKHEPFRQTREETSLFPGDWDSLRGKQVRIIWVQPSGAADAESDAHSKMNMAKSLFRKTYPQISQSAGQVDGVVIVLDSADGGMAAATLSLLQRWSEGKMTDEAFWKQCWFDPPGAFEATANR